jgi:hypothetical protein
VILRGFRALSLLNLQALTESYKNRQTVADDSPTMGFSTEHPITSTPNMTFALRIVYGLLALLALAAFAQPTKEAAEPAKVEVREPVRDTDTQQQQQRRALLRASLRTQPQPQPEVALVRETSTNAGRLLSDQERADLRQQLRQQ